MTLIASFTFGYRFIFNLIKLTYLRRIGLSILCSILAVTVWCQPPALAMTKVPAKDIFASALEKISQQDYESALVDLTQVIDLHDDLVGVAYSDRCLVNLQLQQYQEAKSDCTVALQYNPPNLEARLNLGLVYYKLGDSDKAIAQYSKIVQVDDTDYRAYYNRGLAHFANQDYPAAIADYNRALRSNQEIAQEQKTLIYNDLGVTYWLLADYPQAIANFDQAINSVPDNYSAYFNRGCANHRQNNYAAAIKDFTQVIALNPNLTQAYVNRAMLQHKLGNNNGAFADLTIALKQYKHQGDDLAYHQVLAFRQAILQAQPSQFASKILRKSVA